MDIGELSAFIAIYQCGSITKAAPQVYMSPQGLSKLIAKLERELGVTLFMRSRQGVSPTKYVHEIYPKARDLAETVAKARKESQGSKTYRQLKVALSNGMISYLGLDFISSFELANPGIELRIDECANTTVEEQLLSEEIEVGFLIEPVNEKLFSCSFLMSVPHVLFVSDASAIAQKRYVSYSDLENKTVFLLGNDYPVRKNLEERLTVAGTRPSSLIGIAGADTVLPLVIRDEAVLVSANIWAQLSQRAGLAIVPFEDQSFVWTVVIAQKRGATSSDAAQAFVAHTLAWQAHLAQNHIV